ncbi:hypothetical protein HBM95_23405 [Enterobacter asburiae]|nr:hypothetical protein [Enterobacter asburiae]
MPHKYNAGKRHHILKARFTVTNWSQYENGLRQRGYLTLWISPDVIAEWKATPREFPGGQPRYSDLAIQACPTIRAAYRIPLRQAECLMLSVFRLMVLPLAVPGHTTVSKRAAVLPPLSRIVQSGDMVDTYN